MQKTLPPKAAAWLAYAPYDAEKVRAGQAFIPKNKSVTDHFDFSQTGGVVHGASGSIISTLFNRTTGFAVVGKGKGRFSGDVALGIRGTKMLSSRDWFSNLNTGIGIADNQSRVHAGFQKVFNSADTTFKTDHHGVSDKTAKYHFPNLQHC
ncbi:hypothetical protein Q3O60_10815 [Alkalimonas collagenimarina]|uniref:Uncharacterized protein n=1 Tax=Alkalimonas collagenimarina TaxID=400390 RepID=A0ABT9H053_9GAMM|nr:hypothetical protein [Alkalimonas collagenimarina]MDP4536682.1 hypothetical protein [Alkalimonas collagenimarina]